MGSPRADESAEKTRWIEALVLALLAVLPILPYLSFILQTGVPRFGLFGDFALIEHATRHVWGGDTLLGPYSRFHWNHPGPLLFYALAPFQAVFGSSSTGLYVGTCCVNAAAVSTAVASMRLLASRAHAIAALAVALAWLFAFGNVVANPWNPLLTVLPAMAYLVAVAALASGKSMAVFPAAVLGALVAQTHVATVTMIGATALLALVLFAVQAKRRGGLDARERRRFFIAAACVFVLFIPPLVQQVTASDSGNVRKLASFFVDRREPLKPALVAARNWSIATAWLPERIAGRTLADEAYIPLGMRWEPMPMAMPRISAIIAIAHVVAIFVAAAVAGRRRDRTSMCLLAVGMLANFMAILSLRAIVGVDYHYLVFWTTAGSCVGWMGVLSALFAALGSALGAVVRRMPQRTGVIGTAIVLLGMLGALSTTSQQRLWFGKYLVAPASRPEMRSFLRSVYGSLRERLSRDGSTPVIHLDGSWDIADATLLELEKDGIDVRVTENDRWTFFGVRSSEGALKPLHVYFSTSPLPLPQAACLELIAKQGDIAMYGAPIETPRCP